MDHMTAKVSCFARAYHHKMNRVHIFDDTAAAMLLGADYEKIAQSMTAGIGFFFPGFTGTPEEGLRMILDRQLSPSVLGRSAFAENALAQEIRIGCRQYLLFAAGYDTFALRNRNAALKVFELDLPDMLADKRTRMRSAGAESCAIEVPCDLAQPGWSAALIESGFEPAVKTFGSLLGISYYLTRSEFDTLLAAIGQILTKGSAICFDYPAADAGGAAKVNRALAAGAGEQMKAMYTYAEIESMLADRGFRIYEQMCAEEMTNRFFSVYNEHNEPRAMAAPAGVGYILAVKD